MSDDRTMARIGALDQTADSVNKDVPLAAGSHRETGASTPSEQATSACGFGSVRRSGPLPSPSFSS